MKKQLLSIMLVFTMLATLVAAALTVSAEESEEIPFSLEFTSEITVSEVDTTERVTNAGDIYLAYDWVTRGECDVFINWPDEGYDGKDPWSGSPIRLYERLGYGDGYEFEFIDSQETEPWEPGNTYDAQIKIYSMENPNICKVIDVRVTVEALNIESISVEDYIWAPYTPKSPVINVTYKDGTTSNDASDVGIRYDDEWPTEPGTYELKMSAANGKFNFTINLTVVEIVSVTAKPLTYSELENGDIEFTATYENGFTYTWLDEDTPLPSEVGEHTIEVSVLNDTFTVPVFITVTPSPTTGVWAEGFTWVYDKFTRSLYIKGEGTLPAPTNYDYNGLPIKNIVIDEGIESFEQWALMTFSGGEYESLIFPSTLKSFPALGVFGSDAIIINSVIFREGITNITHLPFGVPGYGAQVYNIYVPASVELVDVYSLVFATAFFTFF